MPVGLTTTDLGNDYVTSPVGGAITGAVVSIGGVWVHIVLNSVNSYGYGNGPARMYGPYFGNVIKRLYSSVKFG